MRTGDAEYLDNCRMKRNVVEYDCIGEASDQDAKELIKFTTELKKEVMHWLRKNHSHLL